MAHVQPAMRLSGTTVLVVEDDLDNLELLTLCLQSEGARVLAAGSIAAGLAAVAGQPVDVLVCDLELPDGDGGALLRQLRAHATLARLPAIAISGYSQDTWRSQAASSGFDRYAVKPFPIDALIALVAALKPGASASEPSATI